MSEQVLNLCFLMLCLGGDARPAHVRLVATQDVYQNVGVDNRLIAAEGHWLIGGYVFQPDTRDVVFAGAVPFHVRLHRRVALDAGAIVATGELPRRGTIVNWLARAQVRLTDLVSFEILHVSNGGPRDIANPAIDSIGFSIRLK
ncbi:MAG: hypothetical protein AB7P34_21490 [Vicinamibacterales bacterium]